MRPRCSIGRRRLYNSQYLSAALIDELHLAIVPVLLGSGEHLLGGLNLPALGYECVERIEGARATHVTLQKRA